MALFPSLESARVECLGCQIKSDGFIMNGKAIRDHQGGDGAWGRIRTTDTRIFNPLLYQLSYPGDASARRFRIGMGGIRVRNSAVESRPIPKDWSGERRL